MEEIKKLERALNSFERTERTGALRELCALLKQGGVELASESLAHNLHCHTFFSYNGYGYSPSYIAWMAKKEGFFAVGSVDFDVLDAVDEFLSACDALDLRGVSGLETRVFIPEFAEREINSPGEPGISYHMGAGFVSSNVSGDSVSFLNTLRRQANKRTAEILERVNAFLVDVQLDFDREVVPLTPSGNATERHVCQAYFNKAESVFENLDSRTEFWSCKLGVSKTAIAEIISDPVALQGMIRSRTMKSGGVGYVKADRSAFPLLKDFNEFIIQCGAMPVLTWLNGESPGENALDELLGLHDTLGMTAVNIIPDRNWNYEDLTVRRAKVKQLNRFVEAAESRDLPIIVGTEMNAPGQKLVDDFKSDALGEYMQIFADGASILYAHTKLQSLGMGYMSDWALRNFADRAARNRFFADFGKTYKPRCFSQIKDKLNPASSPDSLLQ